MKFLKFPLVFLIVKTIEKLQDLIEAPSKFFGIVDSLEAPRGY